MKTYAIVSAAALIIAASNTAYAQEATYEYPQKAAATAATKSRADVRAEVLQARADGTLAVTEADWPRTERFVGQRSRLSLNEQPRAAAGRVVGQTGSLVALHAEPHGFDVATAAVQDRANTLQLARTK